jgi:Fe-S-cluster containining protein
MVDRKVKMDQEIPDRITDLIRSWNRMDRVYSLTDQAQAELEAVALGSVCVPNCGKCCTVPVVTGAEVDYIISTMGALPAFGKQLSSALTWLEHDHGAVDSKQTLEGQIRIVKEMECPFLNYDKTCAIYEARPLSCRMYGVMAPADDFCKGSSRIAKRSTPGYIVTKDTTIWQQIQSAFAHVLALAKSRIPEHQLMGFLPTMLVRQAATKQYNFLVDHDKVQPAKLALGQGLLNAIEPVHQTEEIREKAVTERQTGMLAGEYETVMSEH